MDGKKYAIFRLVYIRMLSVEKRYRKPQFPPSDYGFAGLFYFFFQRIIVSALRVVLNCINFFLIDVL